MQQPFKGQVTHSEPKHRLLLAYHETRLQEITIFFAKYGIKQHLSTPRYPQGSGQAKVSNKIVLDFLKKRLEGAEGKWVDELHGVLARGRKRKCHSLSCSLSTTVDVLQKHKSQSQTIPIWGPCA
ncbi:hypothetical protein L3X38_025505 [Prunus dulcis]|uniref:Integrase catalytic domain-containing protein n=1 Tax=Prunus dulcis TaxID=3755 RepID=A0AAD4W4I8_PRUDU|nr:hypothetical protein L3X38_025505 [Prunus dulcis]